MLTKDTISDIKSSVNIVDVIGEVISLNKAGRNFLGLCPFHGEKTPSFNVVEEKQFYHCFGCGRSGDVFKFIEEYRGVSFVEAVEIVAERSGIPVDSVMNRTTEVAERNPHQAMYDIHSEATRFYHAILMTTKLGEEARQYLYARGLTDEVIKHFQLGLSPAESNYLHRHLGNKFDETAVLNSGLFNLSDANQIYDAFQDRIMFPLSDDNGRVIAFSGRIWRNLDKQVAKYKNSRSTAIFNKSYELYHLDKAKSSIKKTHEVYLMEGFMDVIAAYRSGIENVVASMGTALTKEHVSHLSRYTKKIILTYDGDSAGQTATAKALQELGDFSVEIVQLPNGMDPDEYISKNSTQDLKELLEKSRISDIEFLMNHLKPENIENLQAQIEFVERLAPSIAASPSITAQNSYIYKMAEMLPDFDYQQVELAVDSQRKRDRQVRDETVSLTRPTLVELPLTKRLSKLVRAENHLLHRMVHHPLILNDYRLRPDFRFETEELQILYELLCQNGEISSWDLANQSEQVQRAWYSVLEENLPEELSDTELSDVEESRNKEILQKENNLIGKMVREASHSGDMDRATQELERLIAQKRRME